MIVQDVIDDARNVWLLGTAPQFTEQQYGDALVSVIEELLARGQRGRVLNDPRVRLLMNARTKLTEAP